MIYEELLKQYHSFISDSRLKGLSIRNLKVIDCSTIQLFSEILRGVGRNPKDISKKKGGIKVHAMMDAFSGVTEFVRMTEAREHDRRFLYHLKLAANSWLVFDKAYMVYHQFAKWTNEKIWFVTRMKDNADYHVTKVLMDKTKRKNATGVLKEQYITVAVKQNGTVVQRLKLRRITFKTKEGKVYVFITNHFTLPATQIATIYKNRWMNRAFVQTDKTEFSAAVFLGQHHQRHQDAGVLCADNTITDGGDKKKSGNKEIICQHDYSDTAAPDELCRVAGVYKRQL
jgi:hypothetical protein